MAKKLVCGVGVNDADYVVQPTINGMRGCCPFYRKWVAMLERCYDAKYQAIKPTYLDCLVATEWHSFMAFKSWMEKQDWQGKELDKDLLFVGNKVYSPETCVFVDRITNSFTTDSIASRGPYPLGVAQISGNKFRSQCNNPFTKKYEHLGYFNCPNEAHQAWRKRKQELAVSLSYLQSDPKVALALSTRYL